MKKLDLAPLLAIAVILTGLSVASLCLPDRVFSANENRYLQQAPRLTRESVMTGRFTAEAEKYTADQIALRDTWMEAKSVAQRAMGKRDIGGVWLGSDGYYFTRVAKDDFDSAKYEKNVSHVAAFFEANADKNCAVLLVPNAATVLYDKLPFGTALYNEVCFNDEAAYGSLTAALGERVVLTREALRTLSQSEQVYYRTDHHWTMRGAQEAYRLWAQQTGHEQRAFALEKVSDSFQGSLYSKVLLPDSAADALYLAPEATIESMECDGETMTSLYVSSALETKDKYQLYMGGNYAKTVITTGADTGRSLLLIKDSFANCFVPFLTQDYDTITMLDLRYAREDPRELALQCSDILLLYEMTNFAADSNLYKLG